GTARTARQGDDGLKSAEAALSPPLDQSSAELRDWYRTRFQPRLARAVRLGLVDAARAAAPDRDLRALFGRHSTVADPRVARRRSTWSRCASSSSMRGRWSFRTEWLLPTRARCSELPMTAEPTVGLSRTFHGSVTLAALQ